MALCKATALSCLGVHRTVPGTDIVISEAGKADGFGHNLELSLSQVHKNFLDIQIPVLLMEFCLLSLIKLSSLRIKDKDIALTLSCSPYFMGLFHTP